MAEVSAGAARRVREARGAVDDSPALHLHRGRRARAASAARHSRRHQSASTLRSSNTATARRRSRRMVGAAWGAGAPSGRACRGWCAHVPRGRAPAPHAPCDASQSMRLPLLPLLVLPLVLARPAAGEHTPYILLRTFSGLSHGKSCLSTIKFFSLTNLYNFAKSSKLGVCFF